MIQKKLPTLMLLITVSFFSCILHAQVQFSPFGNQKEKTVTLETDGRVLSPVKAPYYLPKGGGANICPPNIGFEDGDFTNWFCGFGSNSTGTAPYPISLTTPIQGQHNVLGASTLSFGPKNVVSPPLANNRTYNPPVYNPTSKQKFNQLDTFGMFPVICPFGGNMSTKIGNGNNNNKVTAISYIVTVPANEPDFRLTFYYAIVLHNPTGHSATEMPSFSVSITDLSGGVCGNICNNFEVNPLTNGFGWQTSTIQAAGTDVYYKQWTSATINFKNYNCTQVNVQFRVMDCTLGGHFGYAYVDFANVCDANIIKVQPYCANDSCNTVSLVNGYQKYTWLDTNYLPITGRVGQTQKICKPELKDSLKFYVDLQPFPNQGCRDTGVVYFVARPNPVIQKIVGTPVICARDSGQLSVNYTPSFTNTNSSPWVLTPPRGTVLFNTRTFKYFGVAAGNVQAKYTLRDSIGCTDSAFYTITVNPLPTPNIQGDTVICVGKSGQLVDTATFDNTKPQKWWVSVKDTGRLTIDSLTGAISSIKTVISGTKFDTARVYHSIYNSLGCFNIDSVTVRILPQPIVPAISTGNKVCIGKTIALTNALSGGTWYSLNQSLATNVGNIFTGVSAGNVLVKYVVQYGACGDSATGSLQVNPLPSMQPIAGKNSICAGVNTTLTNTTTAASYTWASSNPNVATIDSNTGVLTGVSNGTTTITYTATSNEGCVDSISNLTVTVNSKPIIAPITGSSTLCFGQSGQLLNTTSGGIWFSVDTNTVKVDASGNLTTIKSGNADVRYIVDNGTGCKDSVSVNVTINPLPVIPAIQGNDGGCTNGAYTLTNTLSGGTWSSSNTNVATISSNGEVSTTNAGSTVITYTVTDANNCTSSITKNFSVIAPPTISPIAGNNFVCIEKPESYSSSPTGGTWKLSNSNLATVSQNGTVTGTAVGRDTLYYVASSGPGCSDSVMKEIEIAQFVIKLTATPDSISQTQTINFTTQSVTDPNTYSVVAWSPNYLFFSQTANVQVLKADTLNSKYFYVYGQSNRTGCTSSDSVFVKITPISTQVFIPNTLKLNASNPINAQATVRGNNFFKSLEYKIFNQYGQLIYTTTDVNKPTWDGKVGGVDQPVGVYVYVFKGTTYNNQVVEKTGTITLIRE